MRVLEVLQEEPRPCSYLPETLASLDHRILLDVTEEELTPMLERGWRRFGPDYFRPRCGACTECLPTRIPTATFAPSKSQRRARAKCAALRLRIGRPVFDDRRIELYHRWHAYRESARGWNEADLSERAYRLQFTFAHPAAREIAYHDEDGRLVGVALCDQTDRAWSAIYFFYEPSWAARSIGTANVVFQLQLAASMGIPYVYLGYRVAGCPSLAYKASFRPQEILSGLPGDDEEPRWVLQPSR